ncbi:MAG TPA: hypothetical protein PK231_05695 [Acidocella sp.]|nr:hypothetical protein [Acidocella sp.]
MSWFSNLWNGIIGIFGGGPGAPTPPVNPVPPVSPPVTPPVPTPAAAKKFIGGCVAMESMSYEEHTQMAGAITLAQFQATRGFNGSTINVGWDDLHKAEGVFDFSMIDAGLSVAAAFKCPVEIRIGAGQHVPGFVKNACGPFQVPAQHGPETLTFCNFWSGGYYRAQLQALQAALAAKYDSNPLVRVIWCMTGSCWSDEIMNTGDAPPSRSLLAAQGATDALLQANVLNLFADMAAWKNTPIGITVEAMFSVDDPTAAANTAFPLQVAALAIATYGRSKCVLANMAVGPNYSGPMAPNAAVAKQLPGLGAYTACQPNHWGADVSAQAAYAASLGYNEFQVPTPAKPSAADLAAWNATFPVWNG